MKPIQFIALLLVPFILTGCALTRAERQAVVKFGAATKEFGRGGAAEFQSFRKQVPAMQELSFALENRSLVGMQTGSRESYMKHLNFSSGISLDATLKRVKAMEVLSAYGEALVSIVKDNQESKLIAASSKLSSALQSQKGMLTKTESAVIARIVNCAGILWVEWKKRDTIMRIIPAMSPHIQKICDDLQTDFDITKHGMAGEMNLVQDRLVSESIDKLKRPSNDASERWLELHAFNVGTSYKIALDARSQATLDCIESLRKADCRLLAMCAKGKLKMKDIEDFENDVLALKRVLEIYNQ